MKKPSWTRHSPASILLVFSFGMAASSPLRADLLFFTDFDHHTAGDNQLVGTDGWIGNSTSSGSHGIDANAIPGGGLGNTAFIGDAPPSPLSTNPVFIYRPVNFDPSTADTRIIEFESLLGIEDSTSAIPGIDPPRDSFWIYFYNIAGKRLAGIRFSNEDDSFGIWLSDGVTQTDTGVDFLIEELHPLNVRIDFETNLWTVELDYIPVSETTTFTNTDPATVTRNFGGAGVEWRKGGTGFSSWGNNWMLIAYWEIRTDPFGPVAITLNASGARELSWLGDAGYGYQVQHSTDMVNWTDTPGGSFPDIAELNPITFTDTASAPRRCYHVVRTKTP